MTKFILDLSRGRTVLFIWGVALSVYFLMILGPLAELEKIAGQPVFDMRLAGYSYDAAVALISALGEEGRRIYLSQQIPLDMLYPALFAIAMVSAFGWLSLVFPQGKRWFLAMGWIACGAALADYSENVLIIWMLNFSSDLPQYLVLAASFASIIKSALTTISMSCLLVMLIWTAGAQIYGYRRR